MPPASAHQKSVSLHFYRYFRRYFCRYVASLSVVLPASVLAAPALEMPPRIASLSTAGENIATAAPGTAASLLQLMVSSLQSHPGLLSQQALQKAAQSGVDAANWQFYPTPGLTIEATRGSDANPAFQGGSAVSVFSLKQPLWTGGRLTAGRDKAEASLGVSQISVDEVRLQLALRVLQNYGDWLAAHLKIQAWETSRITHVRLHEQISRRVSEGVASQSDLQLAQGRLRSVHGELALATSQKDLALGRLAQLVGRRIDESRLSLAPALAVQANPEAELTRALASHPVILKAQTMVKVQESVIAERRSALLPEVHVRIERQYGNHTYSNAAPDSRIFIGVASQFDAGLASLSAIEGARAQHQAALAEVDNASRSVTEQVQADFVLARASAIRHEVQTAALEAAEQVAASYDRQFLAGRKSWLDVMNAARELAQTEVQLADIRATLLVSTWRLALHTRGVASVLGGVQGGVGERLQ